jgi:hypothetical protein
MSGIIELRQTGENDWKAKYQGNYGVYTIKVTLKGKKAVNFSCTCPSDYYPCKHIGYIEDAIAEKMAANEKQKKHGGMKVEDIIKNVPEEKLREFIATQAKYSGELRNAIFLEFAANMKNKKSNKYSSIIREALASVELFDEDDYLDDCLYIDDLDSWFEKAKDCVRLKQYDEAVLICKACIEEYSQWLYNARKDASLMFASEYQSVPFDIMKEASKHANKKELFDYCIAELKKKKYDRTDFFDDFHELLGNLAVTVDPEAFIALQDELLANIMDKGSSEAKTILQRKIDFYRRRHQPDKAWALIEENMQIPSFRKDVAEKRIKEHKFSEAKKLINDYIIEQKDKMNWHNKNIWRKLLLEIAQKEKDTPAIRKLAYEFIEGSFNKEYFDIYKTTFNSAEWAEEREKLFLHYDKSKYFSASAADLLAAEEETERLLHYVEKYLSIERLVEYYKNFASAYPEKTLELFRKALVSYAENNTGRSYYEYILSLLRKMKGIEGGKKVASDLAADFRIRYKNRRAMMEILGRF